MTFSTHKQKFSKISSFGGTVHKICMLCVQGQIKWARGPGQSRDREAP